MENLKREIESLHKKVNRDRIYEIKGNKLGITEDFEIYFLYFSDNNWDYQLYRDDHVTTIDFRKNISRGQLNESFFNTIVENMYDARYKILEIEKMDSKFLIAFNNTYQQEIIEDDYRECRYVYKEIEPETEIVRLAIKYVLI